jgi:hypothetical protein
MDTDRQSIARESREQTRIEEKNDIRFLAQICVISGQTLFNELVSISGLFQVKRLFS